MIFNLSCTIESLGELLKIPCPGNWTPKQLPQILWGYDPGISPCKSSPVWSKFENRWFNGSHMICLHNRRCEFSHQSYCTFENCDMRSKQKKNLKTFKGSFKCRIEMKQKFHLLKCSPGPSFRRSTWEGSGTCTYSVKAGIWLAASAKVGICPGQQYS